MGGARSPALHEWEHGREAGSLPGRDRDLRGGAAVRNTDNDPASSKAAGFGGMHEGEVGTQFQEAGMRADQPPQGRLLLFSSRIQTTVDNSFPRLL